MLADNPGHDAEAYARMAPAGGSPPPESFRPGMVGDHSFLGAGCVVYPGARVGDGVVARADTHLLGTIPPFCVVAGNPGKVRRLLKIPRAIREMEGEERYQEWVAAREAFAVDNPDVKREE